MHTTPPPGASVFTGIFMRQGQAFGIAAKATKEFIETRDMEPTLVPRAPSWLAGILNHHGDPLPLIMPDRLLGLPAKRFEKGKPVVAIQSDSLTMGIQVDQMLSVANIPLTECAPHPLHSVNPVYASVAFVPGIGVVDILDPGQIAAIMLRDISFGL